MSNSVAPNSATPAADRTTPEPESGHLVGLIEAARQEAERLGPAAAAIARGLADLAGQARAGASGSRQNEGLRPEELTTGNDR